MEPRTKQRTVRGYGRALGHVGVSVAFGEKNLAVFDHRNHGAGDIFPFKLSRHQAIEKSFEVDGGHPWAVPGGVGTNTAATDGFTGGDEECNGCAHPIQNNATTSSRPVGVAVYPDEWRLESFWLKIIGPPNRRELESISE